METYPTKKQEIYDEYLKTINDIRFTQKQIDVLSCLIQKYTYKSIADILQIGSVSTIKTHVRIIKDLIRVNSVDDIINFINRSGRRKQIQTYFFHVYAQSLFESKVKKIAKILNRHEKYYRLNISSENQEQLQILTWLVDHLKMGNIKLIKNKSDEKGQIIELCELTEKNLVEKQNATIGYINFIADNKNNSSKNTLKIFDYSNKGDYYKRTLKLIKWIINSKSVDLFIEEFQKDISSIYEYYCKTGIYKNKVQDLIQTPSRNKVLYGFVIVLLILAIISFLVTVEFNINSQESIKTETWNIPKYIESYTKRPKVTEALWKKLEQNNNISTDKNKFILGLYGLSGIGKTTIAKEMVNYTKIKYNFIGWFNAESRELLDLQYIELGQKYNLFNKDSSSEQKVKIVKKWLENLKNIFLVYDNAPDCDILLNYLPNHGNIIITSTNYKLPGATAIEIMDEEESKKLLNKLLLPIIVQNKISKNDLSLLAKKLGYLPLAMSQASAYILENMMSVKNYLSLYDSERDILLSDNTMPVMDKHEAAYITWDMALKKIQQDAENEKIVKLLSVVTFCNYDEIPKALVAQYLYGNSDNRALLELNKLLIKLKKYSLVKVTSNSFSMHSLVHSWLKSRFSDHNNKLFELEKIIVSMKELNSWISKTGEDVKLQKLLIPHAENLLSEVKATNNLELNVKLSSILGTCYYTFGYYEKCREFFNNALIMNRKKYSNDHPDNVEILNYLGLVHIKIGDFDSSKNILMEALEIAKKNYGDNNIKVAYIMKTLEWYYLCVADYAKALELLENGLSILEKYYSTHHISISEILYSLGRAHLYQGNYNEAKFLITKAVNFTQANYDENHISVALALHNLGKILLFLGEYEDARELLEKSLKIRDKHFGSNHIEVAFTTYHLGFVYSKLADKRGIDLLNNSLKIHEKYFGKDHIQTSHTIQALGEAYILKEDYEKAEEYFRKSYDIKVKTYGEKNIFTLNSLNSLCNIYIANNEFSKTEKLLEKIYTHIQELYEEDNIFVAKSIANLGNMYRLIGKYNESEKMLKKSLDILYKNNYFHKEVYAQILANLGFLYNSLGQTKLKNQFLKEAHDIFKKLLPPNHPFIQKLNPTFSKDNIGFYLTFLP